jgi:hypothetical protein
MHIMPDGPGLSIHLTEREGLADEMIEATPASN